MRHGGKNGTMTTAILVIAGILLLSAILFAHLYYRSERADQRRRRALQSLRTNLENDLVRRRSGFWAHLDHPRSEDVPQELRQADAELSHWRPSVDTEAYAIAAVASSSFAVLLLTATAGAIEIRTPRQRCMTAPK